jgi:hypothetical protein
MPATYRRSSYSALAACPMHGGIHKSLRREDIIPEFSKSAIAYFRWWDISDRNEC